MYLYSLLIQLNFIFQWILSQVDAHQFGRICSHDPSILEKIMPQEYYDSIEERSKRRILETGSAQPFRVTTDYSYLDDPTNGSDMNDTKKKYIIKIMQASQMFLKNFIKVIPRSTPIKKRGDTTCYDVTVPNYLKDSGNGQTDSDLHILVTFENSPNSSNLANAVACDFDPGPIVGRIKFNIGTMKNIGTTAWAFESDFSTAIHEITHILGFSSSAMQYWIDPDTNKPYGKDGVSKIQIKDTVRGISDVIKLKSKNVLETARRYYNCPTLDSLPMENQGGSGSFGSHWERDLIQNEYMTASSVQGHAVISEFTASLLLDTGFYAEINTNMVEQTYWGKDKGCDFITQSCDNSQQKYPEFSYQDNDHLCDYYSLGQGYAKSDKLDPFSQCKQIQIYSNQYCFDEISYQPNQVLRNNSGQGSKCFFSTSIQNGFSLNGNDDGIRCHKYECNLDNTQINVILWNEIKVSCTTPQQIIDLSNYQQQIDTKGNLNCPSDFNIFCNFPKSCSNFCNGNGICSKAVCYCLDGFAGEDCSKQCAPSLVWDGNKCVTVCPDKTFQNPDNTCKQTCPKAYYQKADIKTCILCHKTCSNCTGPLNSQCSECNSGYYLQGTTCQDQLICDATCLTCTGQTKNQCLTCQDGKFLDSLNSCQICQTPCSKCADSTSKCTGCVIDYNFNPSSNSCSPICDQTCLTCSSPKDSNKCLSCIDGFFLSSGKCIQCQSPCSTCIDTSTKCLKCIENYKLDNIYCIPICDNQCKTCSKPYDSNSCTSCNDGLFLKGTTCISCSHPCQKCDSSSIKCLSCISNYSYNNQNFECNPICHSSCKTCSLPNDFQSCQSCNEGSFLSGAQCLLCTSPCKTCDQQTQKCLSCLDGYFLSQNACKQCQNPCQNCQDETKCLSCISNDYNYDQNSHKCICKCHTDCKSCSGPTQQDCTDCFDSYYLENNICKKCLSPCNNCNRSQDTCTSCINGYNLNGNQCIINCDSSCKTCNTPNDSNNCSSCKDGFYLDKGACKNCQSPCSNCKESATKCLDCNLNYKLESSQCNPICDTTCKTCSNPLDDKSCISCFDGFYLQNSKCLKCQSPCETCIQNSSKCLTCQNGYKLSLNNPNSCELTCDSSCLTCSQYQNPKACLTCSDGKYLESKQCKYCPANCALCSDSSKCQKCQPNYQINLKTEQCELICDQSCVTCSQPKNPKACLTCTPQQILVNGSCQECQPGSYINSEKCSNCPENCKVCKDSNYCEQCYSDYFLDANKSCKQNPKNFQCHYSCKTCQGTSYSDCKSCTSDRILNIKYKDPKNSQAIWICECPKETSDFNELGCDKSKIQSQLKTTTTAFFISSGSTTAFMSIASANPLVIGGLFDFCQTVSFFTYVNEKPALGFDNAAQNLYVSHITKIFDFSKLSSNNHSRILQVGQSKNNNVDALNNIELEQRNSLYDQVFTDNNKSQNKFVYMDYKSNSNYIKKQSCNNQEKKRSSILDNSFSNQQNKYPSINNRMQINHDSIYCEDTNNKRVGDNQQWNFDQIDRQMQIQKNRVYRLEYYRYYMPHKSQKVKNFGGGIF
ncbi:hypothetical protein ABPG72_019190 [Tetrahymena utriculariae]